MKHVLGFLLLLLVTSSSWAQLCNCDRLKPGDAKAFEYDDDQAQRLVTDYSRYFRRHMTIVAKPFSCLGQTAVAKICGPLENKLLTDKGNYIFYSNQFLDRLQKASGGRGDQFILAHEVAHHVLGHITQGYYVGKTTAEQSQKRIYAGLALSADHLHELEADAMGLWIATHNGINRRDIQAIFRVLPDLLRKDADKETPYHPSLAMRQRMLEKLWDRVEKEKLFGPKIGINDRVETDTLNPSEVSNTIHQLTEGVYAFELIVARDSLANQFNQEERAILRQLDRQHRFSVDVVLGAQFQRPVLAVGGEPVTAAAVSSGIVGVRVGWKPWYKPHRFEVDLLYNPQTFTTQAQFGDVGQTAERFSTKYLQFRPRYVRQLSIRKIGQRQGSLLWSATAGLSVLVPLQFTYENFGVPLVQVQSPRQQVGLAPVVGVGYGFSNWQRWLGSVRLNLLYQWQWLRFDPIVTTSPIRATMHTVSLEASVRIR